MSRAVSQRCDRRLLLPALLSAIILGILGMHVLSQHCAMSQGEPGATTSHHDAASMGMSMGMSMAGLTEVTVTVDPAGGGVGPGEGSLMVCAFIVLAVATALLLTRLRGHPARATYAVRRGCSAVRRRLTSLADTGPPYLWDNSVVRC